MTPTARLNGTTRPDATNAAGASYDRAWMLAAARGDIDTDDAAGFVRLAKGNPAYTDQWAELTDALTEGDQRHPGDPRRRPGPDDIEPWATPIDTDPATTQAFDATTREHDAAPRPPAALLYRSTRLADVQPERLRWLWPSRLPVGKLVTLDGDPDVGKSTLTLDLVARITTGQPMPGEALAALPASPVVLLAAEDGLADTIRPRLDAAGADPTKVHHFDAVPVFDDDGQVATWVPPSIPEHLDALEALITETGAVLVVIDVLMAYLSGRADSHRDQDVRRALSQLADIAERTQACMILLRHLRKSRGAAMYAGGGSIGIIGIARAGMVAAHDPADDTGTRRILARAKGNLAPPYPSLAYTLTTDPDRGVARIDWLGEADITGDDLLAPPAGDEGDRDDAEAVLRDILAAGPVWVRDVLKKMADAGFSHDQAKRAKKSLRVRSKKSGVPGDDDQKWRWVLPDPTPEGSADPPKGAKGAGARTPPPSLPSAPPSGQCDRCGGPVARTGASLCPRCTYPHATTQRDGQGQHDGNEPLPPPDPHDEF